MSPLEAKPRGWDGRDRAVWNKATTLVASIGEKQGMCVNRGTSMGGEEGVKGSGKNFLLTAIAGHSVKKKREEESK